MKNDKKFNEVLLTQELYESILVENKEEILKLKELQSSSLEEITKKLKELEDQKNELKEIKKQEKTKKTHIKLCRRALRKEKRKLRGINSSLRFESDVMMDLNANFISEEKQHIKLKNFVPKTSDNEKR